MSADYHFLLNEIEHLRGRVESLELRMVMLSKPSLGGKLIVESPEEEWPTLLPESEWEETKQDKDD